MNKQPKYKIDNARLSRLVAKAQNGSRKAMEDVINMVSGYLYYYSLTLLGDEEQAKDAVQDILLTILKKLDTLDDPKAFLGWMKTIAANYCKTKLSRTKEHISIDEGTWEFADENDQICPEKSAETEEVCGYVREAVRALKHREKPPVLRASVHEKISGAIRRRGSRLLRGTAHVRDIVQPDPGRGKAKEYSDPVRDTGRRNQGSGCQSLVSVRLIAYKSGGCRSCVPYHRRRNRRRCDVREIERG